MIYSRWGNELEITGNAGKHKPKGFTAPDTLVRAIRSDDRAECYYFLSTVRADGGVVEIQEALDRAPVVTLKNRALALAILRAS